MLFVLIIVLVLVYHVLQKINCKTKYMLFYAATAAALPSPLQHTSVNSGSHKSTQAVEWMVGVVSGWKKYAGR